MKNSGIQWIGDIPSTWKTIQLKRHSRVISGKEVKVELEPDEEKAVPVYGSGGVFKYTDREQYCGEVVMFGRKGTIGKPLYVNDRFWAVDTMYFLIHDKLHLFPKFNYYQLCAFNWDLYTTQTALPSIVASEIMDSKFPFPPIEEQKVISCFLDSKCTEIDGLLGDLDKEVKTLQEYKKSIISETVTKGIHHTPTKQTGIPWTGEIPSSWNLERLQYCIKEVNVKNNPIQTDFVLSLTIKDGVLPYDEKGDIGNKAKENHADYKLAFPNTIVLNSMNILIGAVGISKYFGCVSPVYYVFKNHEDCDLRYINYVLSSISFQKYLRNYAKGILEIRLRVSAFDILKQKIPVPSLDEQIEIANYLDSKCAAIDQAITDKTQQIETLKAYKSSLIYEYVTGKKQVL